MERNPFDFNRQEHFVILRQEARVHRRDAQRMQPLKAFADVFLPPERLMSQQVHAFQST